jgi:hypothetical protein
MYIFLELSCIKLLHKPVVTAENCTAQVRLWSPWSDHEHARFVEIYLTAGRGAIEMSRHTTRTCPDTPKQKCPDNSNRKCPDTFACRDISYWATRNIPTAQQEMFRHFLRVGTFPVGQWEMFRQIEYCRDISCWPTGNVPTRFLV